MAIQFDNPNIPGFEQRRRAKRLRAILIAVFLAVLLLMAYVAESFFGVPARITCPLAPIVAVIAARIVSFRVVYHAEKEI